MGKFLDISEPGISHMSMYLFNRYLRWDIAFRDVGSCRLKGQAWGWGQERREVHGTLPFGETQKDGERNRCCGYVTWSIAGPVEYGLGEADWKKATTQECHHQKPFNSWPWGSSGDGRERGAHVSRTPARKHIINIHISYWVSNYPAGHIRIIALVFTDNKMDALRAESACLKSHS